MANIEPTREQISKLLEMCKKLFPERCPDYMSEIAFCDPYYNLYLYDKGKIAKAVHWFEFCIYHICYELSPLYEGNMELIWISTLQSDNIIDFLYEQFKKLK